MTTIYICGLEASQKDKKYLADAEKVKARLKSMKCTVVTPWEMAFAQMSWSDTLHNRVELLKKSRAIYVLPNWKESIMARIELTVAMDMKIHAFFHPVSNKEIKQLIASLDN